MQRVGNRYNFYGLNRSRGHGDVRKSIIDDRNTGCSLRFGDGDALVDMVRKTAYLEGFGKDLALGSYRMAEKYGHPELSVTVKKQEFAGYDPGE